MKSNTSIKSITGMKTIKKVLITGGHFTPGLAVIPILQERGWSVEWVGVAQAFSGVAGKTIESQMLPGLKVPFHSIITGKFHRHSILLNLFYFWKIPFGFLQSLIIVGKTRPDVVLSFGSFVSVPVCLCAVIFGIPIVIHEQTAASGLANRFIAHFAKRVAISFSSSKDEFPQGKTILIGNLIRENIFKLKKQKKKLGAVPTIYITGGSRGSQIINNAVDGCLGKLIKIAHVIHQTGQLDSPKFYERKKTLGANYKAVANFTASEVEEVLTVGDLAVSRSGANTVAELAVVGIPALFIPLPGTERDEQTKNAQVLANLGVAKILNQINLTPQSLLENVQDMLKNLDQYKKNKGLARGLIPQNAPERLIAILEEVCAK